MQFPSCNETPAIYSERLANVYASYKSKDSKKNGQYFTTAKVASFMASMFNIDDKNCLNILDPGAGTGILSCAVLEVLSFKANKPITIDLVAYETDKELTPLLKRSLEYAKTYYSDKGIDLNYSILESDFVLENATAIFASCRQGNYDFIISNPPYFKIKKSDPRSLATSSIVYGQPNMYSLFMAVSASLLKPSGELVFITPRSYTAGYYFKYFRNYFFSKVRPIWFHLFASRKDAFNRYKILQENLIIHAKYDPCWLEKESPYNVKITSSYGVGDIDSGNSLSRPLKEIVNINNGNKTIHIPTSDRDIKVHELVASWQQNLALYNINISTGPVVPFRATTYLVHTNGEQCKPLFWMSHVSPMSINWPINNFKKPQYIKTRQLQSPILVENNNYIFLRRFSSKEQNRRLVAAPYLSTMFNYDHIGIENHLNYLYRPNGNLSLKEMYGLAAILNCSIIDDYFRTYNGNTQVSATEIRDLPLPEYKHVEIIGEHVLDNSAACLDKQDDWVTNYLLEFTSETR